MKSDTIAIVGATGKTGGRVLSQLKQLGYSTRGLSRESEYAFDWDNKHSWEAALEGVHSAYVTYYPDLAISKAESDIRAFVELAKSLGIKHLVLLSGRGEDGAERAESVIQNSGLTWNVVRASWFMQNFSESFMLEGIKAGELILPIPKATEPFIDVNDIADIVVATLTRHDLHNQLLEVTGPELISFNDCISAIAKASHRPIGFQTMPITAYLDGAKSQGLPDDIAWLINELFVNVLDGRNEFITDTIEQVLERPARHFQDYVADTVQTNIWSLAESVTE